MDRLPRFTELRPLPSSGPGAAVLARDPHGAIVIVRYLDASERHFGQALSRYRLEAEILRKLNSARLVGVRDVVDVDGGAAVVIDVAGGVPLRLLIGRRLDPEAALVVLHDCLSGLEVAHDAGVVHGDVNPDNLLVDRQGSVRLSLLGIAVVTTAGSIPLGAAPYMAPERWETGASTTGADLYAAAAVTFECLGGHPPFDGDDIGELRRAQHDAVNLDDIPESLRPLFAQALAGRTLERPTHAAAFNAALEVAAVAAYGEEWERRGRSQLSLAARRVAARWEAGAGRSPLRLGPLRLRLSGAAAALGVAGIVVGLAAATVGTLAILGGGASSGPGTVVRDAGFSATPSPSALATPTLTPTPSPTPTPRPTPRITPRPTQRITPRPPTPTPKPTPTPTPCASPTPGPTPTPLPSPCH